MDTNQIRSLRADIINATSTLRQQAQALRHGLTHDENRDLYDIFGYKLTPTFEDFYGVYSRQDIAKRIVDGIARSCWREGATIKDGEEKYAEKEMEILVNSLQIFRFLERADILNRIGSYSLLYIGVPDGSSNPSEPLGMAPASQLKDIYFQPYAEDGCSIQQYDSDPASRRFNHPLLYNANVINRTNEAVVSTARLVHWTRIVHLAEGALDADTAGVSTLKDIFNRLIDLDKIVGGAAEAYFRNSKGKFAIEADKEFKGRITEEAKAAISEELTAYTNQYQEFVRIWGQHINPLNTPHADPTGSFQATLQLISGAKRIPMRILTGVGSGQLAGNEDKASYNQLISDRQNQECSFWLLRLLEILIEAGLMPEPKETLSVEWPINAVLSELEESQVAASKTAALVAYGNSFGAAEIVPEKQFVEEILGLEYQGDILDKDLDQEIAETEEILQDEQTRPDQDADSA